MGKPTVMTIVGTRPEIIRLSETIKRFDQVFKHELVHTGQNDHAKLKDVFFEDLGLRQPDHYLNVDTSSFGSVMADTIRSCEKLFGTTKPDAVVVLGDTNSAISLLVARRMAIPTYHLEAGNRSFDENVPEEVNRRMVDHVADYNLVYNSYSYGNLIREGIHPRFLHVTGSPIREIVHANLQPIENSSVLQEMNLSKGSYFLVSIHRQENVDSKVRLNLLIESIVGLAEKFSKTALVSTHPRTRKRIDAWMPEANSNQSLKLLDPFGFHDYMRLQRDAFCVLSDSGTISEESAILGFPAVSLRESFERWEASDAGTIVQTGLEIDPIEAGVREVTSGSKLKTSQPEGYEVSDFSQRVTRYILSTFHSHKNWKNLRDLDAT